MGLGRKDGERKVNVMLAGLRRQGLEVDGVCLLGEPVETILSQASGWEADLISVGAQGRQGLSRLVLGCVAEGVLRRAGCPVLIVKHALQITRAGARHEWRRTTS